MVIKHFVRSQWTTLEHLLGHIIWGASTEASSTAPLFLFPSFPLFSLLLCLDQLRVVWVLLYISR